MAALREAVRSVSGSLRASTRAARRGAEAKNQSALIRVFKLFSASTPDSLLQLRRPVRPSSPRDRAPGTEHSGGISTGTRAVGSQESENRAKDSSSRRGLRLEAAALPAGAHTHFRGVGAPITKGVCKGTTGHHFGIQEENLERVRRRKVRSSPLGPKEGPAEEIPPNEPPRRQPPTKIATQAEKVHRSGAPRTSSTPSKHAGDTAARPATSTSSPAPPLAAAPCAPAVRLCAAENIQGGAADTPSTRPPPRRAAKLFVAKAAALDSYEVVGALLVAHANAKKAATPRKLEALLQKNELSLAAARALEALAEAAVGPQAVRANGVGYSLAAATRGPGGLFALARRYLCGKKQFSLYLDFVEAFAPANLVRRTRRRPSFHVYGRGLLRRARKNISTAPLFRFFRTRSTLSISRRAAARAKATVGRNESNTIKSRETMMVRRGLTLVLCRNNATRPARTCEY